MSVQFSDGGHGDQLVRSIYSIYSVISTVSTVTLGSNWGNFPSSLLSLVWPLVARRSSGWWMVEDRRTGPPPGLSSGDTVPPLGSLRLVPAQPGPHRSNANNIQYTIAVYYPTYTLSSLVSSQYWQNIFPCCGATPALLEYRRLLTQNTPGHWTVNTCTHNASCSYRGGMFYVELSDYEQGEEAGETVLGEVSSSRGEQRLIVIQSNTITEVVSEISR